MFKLKYRWKGEEMQTFKFKTITEVAGYIKMLFDDNDSLENILKTEKEHNIKIYLTYLKD